MWTGKYSKKHIVGPGFVCPISGRANVVDEKVVRRATSVDPRNAGKIDARFRRELVLYGTDLLEKCSARPFPVFDNRALLVLVA